jgi:hypothetical protein
MADASELTHRQVRCYGQRQVHRRDQMARLKAEYVTGCGMQVPKTDAVLTAAEVDCEHHGCAAVDR